jgi:hypothetical protein
MKKNETLKLLQAHKSELAKQFGVIKLALFGSTARDAAGPNSDVDILIEFDGPATSARCGLSCALLSKEKPCMSDAGKEQREWRFYLDDMLKFARNVQTYTDGLTQAGFGVEGLYLRCHTA